MPPNTQVSIPDPQTLSPESFPTVDVLSAYCHQYPQEYFRAVLYYLKGRELRENKRFENIKQALSAFGADFKALETDVAEIKGALMAAMGIAPEGAAAGPDEDAIPGVPQSPAAPRQPPRAVPPSDGPGYPPVANLPFPTSGPLGSAPAPVVTPNPGAPVQEVPAAPAAASAPAFSPPPPPPNNSRAVSVTPIPRTADGSPPKQ